VTVVIINMRIFLPSLFPPSKVHINIGITLKDQG